MTSPQDRSQPDARAPRVAFVLEQTLGHVTHSANLTALVPDQAAGRVQPTFVPIPFDLGRGERVPGWTNWTLRAGIRARRALRGLADRPDAIFVHTQVAAGLLGRWMRRVPTVVSLDATPKQYDELGEVYAHEPGPAIVESLKHRHLRAVFRRAERLVTWSTWARDDLVASYDVEPERITVIPPGVDVDRWQPAPRRPDDDRPLEVLFVGGALARKGGDTLIAACDRLRSRGSVPEFVLHLVTGSDVEPSAGTVVHHGLTPNSPELVERFRRADVFCLPTRGDCLPLVLAEAGAAGLPLVSTAVGGIPEIVRPGHTGDVVEPGDVDALVDVLETLLSDPSRRATYGANARRLIEREHDARANAGRVIDVVVAALNRD